MTTSTYGLAELLRKWALGELTVEQAVGHLLQHLLAIGNRQIDFEKRLRALEQLPPPATGALGTPATK